MWGKLYICRNFLLKLMSEIKIVQVQPLSSDIVTQSKIEALEKFNTESQKTAIAKYGFEKIEKMMKGIPDVYKHLIQVYNPKIDVNLNYYMEGQIHKFEFKTIVNKKEYTDVTQIPDEIIKEVIYISYMQIMILIQDLFL